MHANSRRIAAAVVTVALAATAFATIAVPAIRSPDRAIRDFSIDYSAARAWRDGGDPFASTSANVSRYVAVRSVDEPEWHPPLYVALFVPLSFLPYRAAASVWAVVSILAILLAGVILARGLGYETMWGAVGGAVALFAPPVVADLGHGQINAVLVLLLIVAWRGLRDGRPSGAVALGAAAALKFFPAVVVLTWIRRDRRAGAQTVVWAAILTVAAALALGHIGSWIDAASHVSGTFATRRDNFSVTAAVARWIGVAPAMALMGTAAAAFLLRRPRPYWIAVVVALAVWPVVWPHYLVCAIPWAVVATATRRGGARIAAMAAASLFAVATLPGPWWTATVGSRPGLWWMAPSASLLAIATSLRAGQQGQPVDDRTAVPADPLSRRVR